MTKYYHITERENLEKIAKKGLEVRHSDVAHQNGVFLWEIDQESIEKMSEWAKYAVYDPVVLEVEVSDSVEIESDQSGIPDCPPEHCKVAKSDIDVEKISVEPESKMGSEPGELA